MMLAAWRGRETQVSELIEAALREAAAGGLGVIFATYVSLGALQRSRSPRRGARDAAWQAFERDQVGYGPLVVPELAEAASRTGDVALVEAATRVAVRNARRA